MATYDQTKAGNSTGAVTIDGYPVIGRRNDAGGTTHADADGKFGHIAIDDNGRVGITDLGETISIDDGGGVITVDGAVTVSGTATVSATDLDIRNLSQTQDAVLIYGSDDGGTTKRVIKTATDGAIAVDVESMPTVTVTGSVTANAGTNLNTSLLALEAGGNLAAAAGSLSTLDDWDETDRAKVNPIVSQAGVQGGSGTVSANTQRVVLATDVSLPAPLPSANRTASATLGALDAAVTISGEGLAAITYEINSGLVGTVAFEATLDDSTWFAINAMHVSGSPTGTLVVSTTTVVDRRGTILGSGYSQVRIRVSAYTSGSSTARLEGSVSSSAVSVWGVFPGNSANALGKNEDSAHVSSDIGVMALGVANTDNSNISGTTGDYTPFSTNLTGAVRIIGDRTHGETDTADPVKIGFKALSAFPTAVTADDRVNAIGDMLGREVTHPYCLPQLIINGSTSLTATATEATPTGFSAVASTRLYITTLVIHNTSGTNSRVSVLDGTAGTVLMVIPAQARSGAVINFPVPLRLGENKALVVTIGVAAASPGIYISAVGFLATI